MADLIITPAHMMDAAEIAPILRAADLVEIAASGHHGVLVGLTRSLALSTHAFAVRADGRLLCLWGIGPVDLLGGVGCPWAVGTDELSRHAGAFLRRCPRALAFALSCYRRLENWVDARNSMAIRWLRWMGFTLEDARPHGPAGMPFHRFTMSAP